MPRLTAHDAQQVAATEIAPLRAATRAIEAIRSQQLREAAALRAPGEPDPDEEDDDGW